MAHRVTTSGIIHDSEWQWVTTNNNEWQEMTTSNKTSDNKCQWVVQGIKWERKRANEREWF